MSAINHEKQIWQNGDIITAQKLNYIEERLENVIPLVLEATKNETSTTELNITNFNYEILQDYILKKLPIFINITKDDIGANMFLPVSVTFANQNGSSMILLNSNIITNMKNSNVPGINVTTLNITIGNGTIIQANLNNLDIFSNEK